MALAKKDGVLKTMHGSSKDGCAVENSQAKDLHLSVTLNAGMKEKKSMKVLMKKRMKMVVNLRALIDQVCDYLTMHIQVQRSYTC